MANVALTPGVGTAHRVKRKRCKLAACDFVELWQFVSINVMGQALGVPVGLHIAMACLSIDTESPCVETSVV